MRSSQYTKAKIIRSLMGTPEGQEKIVVSMAQPLWLRMDYRSIGLKLLQVYSREPVGDADQTFEAVATGSLLEHGAELAEHARDTILDALLGELDPWVIGLLTANAVELHSGDHDGIKGLLGAALDYTGVGQTDGRIVIHPDDTAAFEAVFPRDPSCPSCGQDVSSDWWWGTTPELLATGLCATYHCYSVLVSDHIEPGSVLVTGDRGSPGELWHDRQLQRVEGTEESITVQCTMAVNARLNPEGKVVRFRLP